MPNSIFCRLVCTLMLAIAAFPAAAQPRFDGVTLRVATFGGNWRQIMEREIGAQFAALGGKLEIVAGNPQANFAKLLASRGRPPFDIMDISDAQVPGFEDGDYLAPLDQSRLRHLPELRPGSVKGQLVSAWTSQGVICFNTERFAALGLPAPKTYADLLAPALAGKVLLPDLNSGGGVVAVGAIAYAAGGDEENIGPGLDLITKIKDVKFWTQGDQVVQGFVSGDVLAAVSNSGWCLNASKAGVPVAAAGPEIKPGVVGVENHGWLGIMKSTPNIDAVYWFLDAYLSAEYQLAYSLGSGQTPDNRIALENIGKDPLIRKMVQLDPVAIERQLKLDYRKIDLSRWSDQWNRKVIQR